MSYQPRCSFCNHSDGEGHAKDCICAASYEEGRRNGFQAGYSQVVEDADRLKALWLYPPADLALWKVAYPHLDDFRLAIDDYIKSAHIAHDEKWGCQS